MIAGGGSWKKYDPCLFYCAAPHFPRFFVVMRFGHVVLTEAKDASTCVVGSAPCADVGLGVQLSLWGGLRRHSKC